MVGNMKGKCGSGTEFQSHSLQAVNFGVSGLAWDQVDLFSGDYVSNFR